MRIYPDFSILVVDDEPAWLRSVEIMLARMGIGNVLTCTDARAVLPMLEQHAVGVVLLDLTMPHIQGGEVLRQLRRAFPNILVIIITGMNTAEQAVECLKAGAFDYCVKTWGEERLSTAIRHAVRVAALERERGEACRSILDEDLRRPEAFAHIVTVSQSMLKIFRYLESLSASHAPVLLTGESGVGKELLARAIHNLMGADGRFVAVNMASLDGALMEDTLFGHVKGAYTNAAGSRGGLAEQAQGGTLFLDEIAETGPQNQARLLRFIQEGEYYPLGGDLPKKLAANLVLATNHNLDDDRKSGAFRSDLYYRLATHHVAIPPLRSRKEDIPVLVAHFLRESAEEYSVPVPELSTDLLLALAGYDYPGNVRELKAMIARAVSQASGPLRPEDFPELGAAGQSGNMDREKDLLRYFCSLPSLPSLAEVRSLMTTAAMLKSGGNQSVAARLLGISQPAISKRLNS
jgi:Response regulator containing CheY-like receiver, AAA-type ATPase, and DNA-binding domains